MGVAPVEQGGESGGGSIAKWNTKQVDHPTQPARTVAFIFLDIFKVTRTDELFFRLFNLHFLLVKVLLMLKIIFH